MAVNTNSRHAMPGKAKRMAAAESEKRRESASQQSNNTCSEKASAKEYTQARLSAAKRDMDAAVAVRAFYPGVWQSIEAHALDLASKGQRISMQYLLECQKQKPFIDSHGSDLSVTNDTAAIFGRWLIADHPELAMHIITRRSVCDALAVPCDADGRPYADYFQRLMRIYG